MKPRLSVSPLSRLTWWPIIFCPFLDILSECSVKFSASSILSTAWNLVKTWPSSATFRAICMQGKSFSWKSVLNKCFETVRITALHLLAGTLSSPCSWISVCRMLSEKWFFSSLSGRVIFSLACREFSSKIIWFVLWLPFFCVHSCESGLLQADSWKYGDKSSVSLAAVSTWSCWQDSVCGLISVAPCSSLAVAKHLCFVGKLLQVASAAVFYSQIDPWWFLSRLNYVHSVPYSAEEELRFSCSRRSVYLPFDLKLMVKQLMVHGYCKGLQVAPWLPGKGWRETEHLWFHSFVLIRVWLHSISLFNDFQKCIRISWAWLWQSPNPLKSALFWHLFFSPEILNINSFTWQ